MQELGELSFIHYDYVLLSCLLEFCWTRVWSRYKVCK